MIHRRLSCVWMTAFLLGAGGLFRAPSVGAQGDGAAPPAEKVEGPQKPKDAPDYDKGGDYTRKVKHNQYSRKWSVHLPKGFRKGTPVPLVIALHGMGSNGEQMEMLSGFSEISDREGFAVAYPEGNMRIWLFVGGLSPLKREDGKPRGIDDVGFIRDIMDELVACGVADPRRIYATGISNGGYMSNRLALDLGDRLAAIAPVCGTLSNTQKDDLQQGRAVPVLYIHGTADTVVGYDGKDKITNGKASLSAEELVEGWAKRNGCAEKPAVDTLPDRAEDGMTVERRTYAPPDDRKDGAKVIFLRVIGGGHTWPGKSGMERLGATCLDFDASETIWEFFKGCRLTEASATSETK